MYFSVYIFPYLIVTDYLEFLEFVSYHSFLKQLPSSNGVDAV